MKREEQVTSLGLSKQLKALGIKQDSLFYWVSINYPPEATFYLDQLDYETSIAVLDNRGEPYYSDVISAFTVAELGELLPRCYMSWATPQNGEMKWWCHRMEHHFVTHEETPTFTAETEADARAKMLEYIRRKPA